VVEKCFERFLSDDEMHAQLERGEAFLFTISHWQQIERQIEHLGFGDLFFVTQVSAKRGKLTKVTPVISEKTQVVHRAA